MEFDKSRVYTSLNADELKAGDKVIVADQLSVLKQRVQEGKENSAVVLQRINGEDWGRRFGFTMYDYALAYLVERAENCTNCGEGRWDAEHKKILCDPVNCGNGNVVFRNHEIEICEYYKPIAKQKAEKKYRPFKDTDELIEEWDKKLNYRDPTGLAKPYIWIRRKNDPKDKGRLITAFNDDCVEIGEAGSGDVLMMEVLFEMFVFLDGSPCGVEE